MRKILPIAFLMFLIFNGSFAQTPYDISASSYLGDASDNDGVFGSRIQSNGTIVLAAILGTAQIGGTSINLSEMNDPKAAVIRLTPDGKQVLSVSWVANVVNDLALDAQDNIYVATDNGFVKLNAEGTEKSWSKLGENVKRCDAAQDGHSVALTSTKIYVYDQSGAELSNFDGKATTNDVAIDGTSKTVIYTGFRQATSNLQIAYLLGVAYNGDSKWQDYDWSTDSNSDRYVHAPRNNGSDTRGNCVSMGYDGKLYAGFEMAGGENIFTFDAQDININIGSTKVKNTNDNWSKVSNLGSGHISFFGKYDPVNGEMIQGSYVVARLTSGKSNTLVIKGISADEKGRVYIGGASAWGLPLGPHDNYNENLNAYDFTPTQAEGYIGGPFFMIFENDFKTRLYVTTLVSGGSSGPSDARYFNGNTDANIVWGGIAGIEKNELYTLNAIQDTKGGVKNDGFFAVIANETQVGIDPVITEVEYFKLFPNPATGFVNIDLAFEANTLELMDLSGRLLLSKNVVGLNRVQISIKNIESGIYMVRVKSGKDIRIQKLVIE